MICTRQPSISLISISPICTGVIKIGLIKTGMT
jgi:hypothetical protein